MHQTMVGRLLAVLTTALALALLAAPARAADDDRLVTFAARVCPRYGDITANKARNNIQESLEDLGTDTPYRGGEVVDAVTEDTVQPACRPLAGWRFTLGSQYRSRASIGPWGALSTVLDPFDTEIVTREQTPLLGEQGQPSGSQLAGAVTIRLSRRELELASRPSGLWVQGGTPADPVAYQLGRGAYGFGALRCATDNLNGDNVEWIGYPSGVSHVVCFAYYVSPPPTAGTIVVRKRTEGAPAGPTERFVFEGNISYTSDHRFEIPVSGSGSNGEPFVRGQTDPGDEPWRFRELVPPGWRLTDLTCTSQTGRSVAETSLADASAAVTLAPLDTVTCTYTDTWSPPPGGLLLRKITYGGLGTFPFAIARAGGEAVADATATTDEEGVAAAARPERTELDPGDYRIREQLPRSERGSWSLTGVQCDDEQLDPAGVQPVTIASGRGTTCTYVDRFTPAGFIRIRTATIGGTDGFGYVVTAGRPGEVDRYEQTSRTTQERVPVLARGDDLGHVPLRAYDVTQLSPAVSGGRWELIYVRCDDQPTPYDQGTVSFALTAADRGRDCLFVNVLVRDDAPPPRIPTGGEVPLEPTPGGSLRPLPPPAREIARPRANLVITKVASPRVVRLGGRATYRLEVVNRGPSTAYGVTIGEQRLAFGRSGARLLSLRSSQGRCALERVGRFVAPFCRLGTVPAGGRVHVVGVVRPPRVGTFRNRAVVGSDTPVIGRRRVAVAKVVVIPAGGVKPVAGLAVAP